MLKALLCTKTRKEINQTFNCNTKSDLHNKSIDRVEEKAGDTSQGGEN